jgi:hypothetical protein
VQRVVVERLEAGGERGRAGEAALRFGGEERVHQLHHRARQLGRHVVQGQHPAQLLGLHQRAQGQAGGEGEGAGEHLVEDGPQGVEVRAGAVGVAAAGEALGGHVLHGAAAGDGAALAEAAGDAGQAEVQDLDLRLVGVGDDDVGRLEVQVEDVGVVAVGQRLRHPPAEAGGLQDVERVPLGEVVLEHHAFHELGDQVHPAVVEEAVAFDLHQ